MEKTRWRRISSPLRGEVTPISHPEMNRTNGGSNTMKVGIKTEILTRSRNRILAWFPVLLSCNCALKIFL